MNFGRLSFFKLGEPGRNGADAPPGQTPDVDRRKVAKGQPSDVLGRAAKNLAELPRVEVGAGGQSVEVEDLRHVALWNCGQRHSPRLVCGLAVCWTTGGLYGTGKAKSKSVGYVLPGAGRVVVCWFHWMVGIPTVTRGS
jgi:hypothetical protein